MRTGSLRLRMLVGAVISIGAAVAISALGLTLLFERHVERRVESELKTYLEQLFAGLARDSTGGLTAGAALADPRFGKPLSGLYWQVRSGGMLLRSRSLWDQELRLPDDKLANGEVHRHRIAGPNGAELIAIERSVRLSASLGGSTARAVVAQNAADVAAAARDFATDLVPYLSVLAAFLIGSAYLQVAIGLRPLDAIRAGLAAMRAGKIRRLGTSFPDEIRPLATELDALLEARDQQVAKARARAGDLAHGLKTPLQVLAGDIDRLKSKGETAIAREIEQVAAAMGRHVERELARVRMAAGSSNAVAQIAEVVERIVAVVSRTPGGARLKWNVDVVPGMVARIDPDDLAEAIGNLAENAARHAKLRVEISALREGSNIAISIRDDGPGIPEKLQRKARGRGARLDSEGTGAGLGLAIVNDIAEAWGGNLEIRTVTSGFEAILRIANRDHGTPN